MRKTQRPFDALELAEMREMIDAGLSSREIAIELDRAVSSVYYATRAYNLKSNKKPPGYWQKIRLMRSEIKRLADKGMSVKEISQAIMVAEKTIKVHLRAIFQTYRNPLYIDLSNTAPGFVECASPRRDCHRKVIYKEGLRGDWCHVCAAHPGVVGISLSSSSPARGEERAM